MLSLKYSLTKEDYVNYYTYVVWDAPQQKKKRMFYYFRQLAPLLVFLFAFYYTGLFDRPGKFILLIAGVVFIITLLSFLNVRNNAMRAAERVADDPNNSSIFIEKTLTLSDFGITVKDELLEAKLQWKAILRKLESRNYYFLFYNSIQAVIIPKRIFKNNEEKMQFEKLLTQYLSFEAEVTPMLKSS